jgi:hypothetical protein
MYRNCLLALAAICSLFLAPPARAWQMSDLWPNDDGHSWVYYQIYREYLWEEPQTIENEARIYLDGYAEVPGGITVQNLRIEVISPSPAVPSFASAPPLSAPVSRRSVSWERAPKPITDPFWRNLWWARPDLRAAIERRASSGEMATTAWPPGYYQVLISAPNYRKTADDIGAWRSDQEAMESWMWLVSDLTIGRTFDLQLIPDLADDVWLHATVSAWEDVTVPAGSFPGCLKVDYTIDYGISTCTNEQGIETGQMRSETVGWIDYAPLVGPVRTHEEFIPEFELLWGSCFDVDHPGEPSDEGSLELTSTPPTPVQPTTWGRLKTLYR